jgi:hypothetical protein
LIENNINFILFFLRLMDAVRIRGDEDGGIILPEAENEDEDGEHFRWWGKKW